MDLFKKKQKKIEAHTCSDNPDKKCLQCKLERATKMVEDLTLVIDELKRQKEKKDVRSKQRHKVSEAGS